MNKVILFYLLLCMSKSHGTIDPDNFSSSLIELENAITSQGLNFDGDVTITSPKKRLNNVLKDYESKVDDNFKIATYFKERTNFWFSIYTQYSSHEVLIHDKENLELVYGVINLESIHKTKLNPFVKSHLQNKQTQRYVQSIKTLLNSVSQKKIKNLSESEKKILLKLKSKKIRIPRTAVKRRDFFLKLARNLRTQTGQKNKIYQGLVRARPYLPFFENKLKELSLPKEILAVAFLESGFNFNAVSKVGAVGAWQFMSYTANLTMPKITKHIDYRKSPIFSSLAAIQLLKENKLILKRWDLAITAYNSGTKNLVAARNKYKKTKSLSYILENYKNKNLGFASVNFYAEFLALAHTLAYRDLIFPSIRYKNTVNGFSHIEDISIYLAKCPLVPKTLFKKQNTNSRIEQLNGHILFADKEYKRGLMLASEQKLPSKKYFKLTKKQINNGFPRDYTKYLMNKRCNRL